MEEQIKEELEKVYKDCKIFVDFIDFRKYKIRVIIDRQKEFEIEYKWNVNFTKDYNISIILYNIDKRIINLYKKEIK